MEGHMKARLPSIRELELSCPSRIPATLNFSPHALSPTHSQIASPPAQTGSSHGQAGRPLAGHHGHGRLTGQHEQARACLADGVSGSGSGARKTAADMPPQILDRVGAARRGSQSHSHSLSTSHPSLHPLPPHPLPPHYGAHPPPLNLDTNVKRAYISTPPRSPDTASLAHSSHHIPGFPLHSEVSSSTDDTIAETRRQRRESKERRRRRDQRSLTVCMEQSVPSWVFSRLKTRHSASKVNGGGRATNAVISGACIWLRVLDRAMKEETAHWTSSKSALDRWMALVDKEAASLENWDDDDDSTPVDG